MLVRGLVLQGLLLVWSVESARLAQRVGLVGIAAAAAEAEIPAASLFPLRTSAPPASSADQPSLAPPSSG